MKHRFYPDFSLLVVKDNSGERLFKLEWQGDKFKPVNADFISGAKKFIKVYSDYNLIITPEYLFTLNGQIIEQGDFTQVKSVEYPDTLLLVVQSSQEQVNEVLLWNGKEIIWRRTPRIFIHTTKYIGVHLGEFWEIFDHHGKLLNKNFQPASAVRIEGDLLIRDMLGYHDVYSLDYEELVLQNRQLVRASAFDNFAVGVNMQRSADIWYNGKHFNMEKVEFVELLDEAGIFYVQQQNQEGYDVYLCKYPDKAFIKNAEIVSFDELSHNVIIVKDGIIKQYKSAHSAKVC